MRILAGLAMAFLLATSVHAQVGAGPAAAAARNEADALGRYANPNIHGWRQRSSAPQETVPGYQGSSPSQTQYFQGGQGQTVGTGQARVGACTNATDLECQAVNLARGSRGTRPQFEVSPNDPFISATAGVIKNPTRVTGDIFSSYETCRTVSRIEPPIFETQTCTEWSELGESTCKIGMDVIVDADHLYRCLEKVLSQYNATCTVGRVIRVDPDYNYQCQQSPKKLERLTCTRALTVVCAASGDGCSPSGVVPGSTQGDMQIRFAHVGGGTWELDFGIFNNNTWQGGTAVEENRTMSFSIERKSDLTQFAFVYTRYDDWLLVKVNGTTVFGGPKPGTDRLIMRDVQQGEFVTVKMVQYTANANLLAPVNQGQEKWEAWPNIDIRPWLRDGYNQVEMKVIRDYRGEGAVRFHVRAACPANCTDQWDNGCAALEQRAR